MSKNDKQDKPQDQPKEPLHNPNFRQIRACNWLI